MVMPLALMRSAARMKKGTAIRGKELIPLKKRWGTVKSDSLPSSRRATNPEPPMLMAMGKPIIMPRRKVMTSVVPMTYASSPERSSRM